MGDPIFFRRAGPFALRTIAAETGAALRDEGAGEREVAGLAPIEAAGPGQLTFFDNPRFLAAFLDSKATACFVAPRFVDRAPCELALLITPQPSRAFAQAAALFYPDALRPLGAFGRASGVSAQAAVDPTARLEENVTVEPLALVGPDAEIGRGTVIAAGAVIGHGVRIGRDCSVGPGASVLHALIGDRVIIHAGVRIGQDGFGFAMGPKGHLKVPQVGRVIVQNDVEIGANSTVDRGSNRDTVIGEGTKIDNLVQIGHNVTIGRHCVIAGQAGISGSCSIGDFVAIGGQAGLADNLTVGSGAQIAAAAGLMGDVPAGAQYCGCPAMPARQFFREVAALRKLTARSNDRGAGKGSGQDG